MPGGAEKPDVSVAKNAAQLLYATLTVKQILLIEDDEDDQLFFKDAIDELHLSIALQIARHGAEAIQLLSTSPHLPDLIIMDINMPAMDGMECLKRLKTNSRLQAIPVVIFTTSQNPADAHKALSLGASHFEVKPPTFTLLKKNIAGILSLYA